MYNSDKLELFKAYNYMYLEIIFNRYCSFCKVKKHMLTQPYKAMHGIIRKFDIRLDLFDKVIFTSFTILY